MKSITKKITGKLAWFWFKSTEDKEPSCVNNFVVEISPPANNLTYTPTVVVKSGSNESGIKNQWSKENEPLLMVSSDGNKFDVERYSFNGGETKKYSLDFGEVQYLMIALKQLDRIENRINGAKSFYRQYKGDLKDVILDVQEGTPSVETQNKKLRPMGHVLLELEELIIEMTAGHDLQWGDILNLVRGYLEVHSPEAQEEYVEGGNPEFYYGPKREVK